MAWARLDDQMPNKAKVKFVGPLGLALHVSAICFASRDLTDGFVPDDVVPGLLDLPKAQLNKVLPLMTALAPRQENPLWHRVEGGYEIHDYLEYNPTRESVLAERQKAKDRMAAARSGNVRANNAGTSSSPGPRPDPLPQPDPDPPSPLLLAARGLWQNRIGVVPPAAREEFAEYAEKVPAEWFEQAIEITRTEADRPNWKFCKAVLDRALDEGRPPLPASEPQPTTLNDILSRRRDKAAVAGRRR